MVPTISQLLEAASSADPGAAAALLPLVYDELRMLAAARLANEKPGNTLNPTALVHEAYFRLVGDQQFEGRSHFFAAATQAMRRILVESARSRASMKRGGGLARIDLELADLFVAERDDDLIRLDEALDRLAAVEPLAARLVHLRYFAGCTMRESAELMDMPQRSAGRLWAYAKAWLLRELRPD